MGEGEKVSVEHGSVEHQQRKQCGGVAVVHDDEK